MANVSTKLLCYIYKTFSIVYYAPREEKTWAINISCISGKHELRTGQFYSHGALWYGETIFFTIPWPKLPISLSAQNRECGIFGPGMVKNSIRSTGVKLASLHLVFVRDARDMDCPRFFLPRCVIIILKLLLAYHNVIRFGKKYLYICCMFLIQSFIFVFKTPLTIICFSGFCTNI